MIPAAATIAHIAAAAALARVPVRPAVCLAPRSAAPTAAARIHGARVSAAPGRVAVPDPAGRTVAGLAAWIRATSPSQADRARTIYQWIAANVRWFPAEEIEDAAELPQDAATVLRRRTAVCSGFANLYAAVARAAGLRSTVILGECRGAAWQDGSGEALPHAWNAVMVDGRWRLVDVSWAVPLRAREAASAAGVDMFYFGIAPECLIRTHYPESRRWQMLARPLTRGDHQALMPLRPAFYRYGLVLPYYTGWETRCRSDIRVRVGAPPDVILLAMLKQGDEVVASARLTAHDGSGYDIQFTPEQGARFALSVYAKARGTHDPFEQVMRCVVDVDRTQQAAAASTPGRPLLTLAR